MTELEPSTRIKTASERILESTDYKEAIMIARSDEGIRRDIIRNSYQVFRSIKKTVEVNIQEQKSEIPAPVRNFIIPPEIYYWDRFSTCLWLCGKSGTGKTSFAKSLFKNPIVVRLLEDLKKLSLLHDGIIFDDMNFAEADREDQIHLLDVEEDSCLECRNVTQNFKLRDIVRMMNEHILNVDAHNDNEDDLAF
ncbi:hypothetical protein BB560_005111, partial [Smittium megazygosporum]